MGLGLFGNSSCSCNNCSCGSSGGSSGGLDELILSTEEQRKSRTGIGRATVVDTENVNPDPEKYEILLICTAGEYTLLKVRYPNCTNFEGIKVMLYNKPMTAFSGMPPLDPHFCDNGCLSPIARFEPTETGWFMGVRLMNDLHKKDIEKN